MDNQHWSSGTDSGESIPPVPAPRYKRRTTYEDFKQMSNKPTGANVEGSIIPPPRRKNKTKFTYKTQCEYLCSEDQFTQNAFDKIDVDSKTYTYSDILTIGSDEQICTDDLFQIQDMLCHHVETLSTTDKFQKQDLLGQCKTPIKNIFVNIASHLPSYNFRSLPAVKSMLENRVDGNSSENSAMVVGVFLKPEYTPKKYETCEFVLNQAIRNQVGTIVENCFGMNKEDYPYSVGTEFTSGKEDENTVIGTEENENAGDTNESCVKYVEENDSGVYFSDTKSPVHQVISLEKETKCYNLPDHTASNGLIMNVTKNDTRVDETLTSNNSDNIDNKRTDYMVSENYSEVLNCFEAETVSSFHMEIASRFSLCKEEISQESVVEGSLNDDVYFSRKYNSGLSAYLKSMLESDSGMCSVSACSCVSAAGDEQHYKPDCLGEFKETPSMDSRDVTDLKPETCPVCTVVGSLQDNNDLSQLADSNVDCIVDINNVHKKNVNSNAHCENENTFFNENIVYSININSDESSEDMENTYQKKSFVDELIKNHRGNVLIANNILNSEHCVIADDRSSDLFMPNSFKTKNSESPPLLRHGLVSTLVAFFESVHTQELSNYYGSDNEVGKVSDSSSLSPEGIEEVYSAKLITAKSPWLNESTVSINYFTNMHENGSDLEDHLLNINGCFKAEMNGPDKMVEVPSSKSTSLTFSSLYEYSSCTVGHKNIMVENKTHDFYLNESVQNKLNIMSDAGPTWINPSNHHSTFAYCNSDTNISPRENTDFTALGDTCELDKVNSFDLPKNSQNAMNGGINCAYSMMLDDKDSHSKIIPGIEHRNMNTNDVVCDSINHINVIEENVFIETQGSREKSRETSLLQNANSLYPDNSFTTSKIIVNKEEDIIDPTNNRLKNLATLHLLDAVQSTKDQFFPSKPKNVFSPIGSIDFNSLKLLKDRTLKKKNNEDEEDSSSTDYDLEVVGSSPSKREVLMNFDSSNEDELKNALGIILEKNWGSLGITFKRDEEGVFVDDVLAGGSADWSGLVHEGS